MVRGRTEPEEAGRAEDFALLLFDDDELDVLPEGLAVVEGLPTEEGLPPDAGFADEAGFAVAEGELAEGAEGFSEAGGGVACATGAPPEDRL